MDIGLFIWILFFFAVSYFAIKRYYDKKKEDFEDRDN